MCVGPMMVGPEPLKATTYKQLHIVTVIAHAAAERWRVLNEAPRWLVHAVDKKRARLNA